MAILPFSAGYGEFNKLPPTFQSMFTYNPNFDTTTGFSFNTTTTPYTNYLLTDVNALQNAILGPPIARFA
jgi:hypothetical protein